VVQVLTVPFLAFQLESKREEVAVPMCVNRDAPELACFGSCYISQQLTEAFEHQQQPGTTPEAGGLWQVPFFAIPSQEDWQLRALSVSTPAVTFSDDHWQERQYVHPQWHPPRV
jgi:hypothetical protein